VADYGPQYGYGHAFPHPPPPDAEAPELPAGADAFPRWPPWYGPAALAAGLIVAFIGAGTMFAIAGGNPDHPPPAVVQIATVFQDAVFVGAALFFAARTARPRLAQFGLRAGRLWSSAGWAVLGLVTFLVFGGVYSQLVDVHEKQTIVKDLGAKDSDVALVGGAVLVIVIAPLAEELFFRGFFYRALRTRMAVPLAAVIDGLVFGAIHAGGSPIAVLPVLAMLGFIFCLVYERTGTLFATIAMHAVNNFAAYGGATRNWSVAGGVALVMLTACVTVPALLASRRPAVRSPATS
jgi:membrane protease YdiL (CAAX protease family)